MSTVKANNVQVGQSGTATNNFTLYQPSTPDGTVRLAVGNSGATSADVLTANSSGNVGIGETSPGTRLDVKGNGVPLTINSANSNGNKVQFEDNGTVKAYFGTTSFGGVVDCCFQASDSSGNTRFSVVAASGTIGLNTQPATTGTGITFPATQSASSDANTLDDYEEGTWTPIIEGSSTVGTVNYTIQNARYTKIGRVVQIECYVLWSSGTGAGSIRISGLPFTSSNSSTYPQLATSSENITLTANNYMISYVNNNSTFITIAQNPIGGGARSTVAYDASGEILVAGTYIV